MTFFDECIHIKIRSADIERLENIMHAYPDRWENQSHFVRAAIRKLLQEIEDETNIQRGRLSEQKRLSKTIEYSTTHD
jgi:hypothetical protein